MLPGDPQPLLLFPLPPLKGTSWAHTTPALGRQGTGVHSESLPHHCSVKNGLQAAAPSTASQLTLGNLKVTKDSQEATRSCDQAGPPGRPQGGGYCCPC